ncbi:energy transducer TonB [Myxococcus sp. AM011]|uniref:energy transducer TonB n=1 Tax=Myxococcus sp. AM011 TaxID=2745200 RepID=UPI0015958DFD|nr:energy transducer TonB [Myxococcus sp. AM011]NVJ22379.1 energy transducer TonB [Myxococcus sp. AM011]
MRPLHVVLCALLLGATACGHSARVPSLPASHGHLSRAMAHYLDPTVEGPKLSGPTGSPPGDSSPTIEVEPEQAPSVFAEAVQALSGTPTQEQLRQASADIGAACRADLNEACDYMRTRFQRPKRIAGQAPLFPPEAMLNRAMAIVVLTSRLGVDGQVRNIRVLESAPYGLTEAMIASVRTMRFEPAKLAGHPVEMEYVFQFNTTFSDVTLTAQEELDWARTRTELFPTSSAAWVHLARVLARDKPEDAGYTQALAQLNRLSPEYWWSATELAWLHAQAGRYVEAEPLTRVAKKSAPDNPYVLETVARVAFHRGRCSDSLLDQQQAIAKLPSEWPQEEQARFKSALAEYQRQCPSDAPAPAPAPASAVH